MDSYHWIIDNHFNLGNRAIMYKVEQVIASARSDFQQIFIVDLADFGRALMLDGDPQSSQLDEGIYHESLVQPAMIACPVPRRVFIAGGGEGATLREALRHNTVEQVVMVDIDPLMVTLAREHLEPWHRGAFDDPRAQVLNQDARAYLEEADTLFDVILIDVADPLEGSPAALLYTREFYEICRRKLAPGGTLAVQAEAADVSDFSSHLSVIKTLRACFPSVLPYTAGIPFFGLNWGFALAGEESMPERLSSEGIAETLLERAVSGLRFYDPESHRHIFSLPRFLRDALADPTLGIVIEDLHPLVVV